MENLIDIMQLSTEEIDELVKTGCDIMEHPAKYAHKCDGKILATLFFEPSTRTRLSFESAMLSLGGQVLGFSSAASSSASKGESVADTIRVVSAYCDIIAMRHPKEGAPLVATQHSLVPVINAGDGGHNHPTQTLTDLITIHKEKGHFDNLTIGFCGDLKFGRTVHSLVAAMSRYTGVRFVFVSPEELKLPRYVKEQYVKSKNIPYTQSTCLEEVMPELDILYMTRVQKERFFNEEDYLRLKDSYILTPGVPHRLRRQAQHCPGAPEAGLHRDGPACVHLRGGDPGRRSRRRDAVQRPRRSCGKHVSNRADPQASGQGAHVWHLPGSPADGAGRRRQHL